MRIRVLSQDDLTDLEGPAVRAVNEKYVVRLSAAERARLESLPRSGKGAAQTLRHAGILLKAEVSEAGPGWSDEQIRAACEVGCRRSLGSGGRPWTPASRRRCTGDRASGWTPGRWPGRSRRT